MDNTIQPSGLQNLKFGYRLDNGLPVDNTIGLQSGLQSLTLDDGGAGSASASASASASDGAAAAQPQQQQHQQHQQQQQQQQKQRQPRRKWNEADFKIEHRKWTFVGDRPVRDPPPGMEWHMIGHRVCGEWFCGHFQAKPGEGVPATPAACSKARGVPPSSRSRSRSRSR